MTYIEFFDKTASENICACLTYVPDRVVYVGDNSGLIKKHIEKYKLVFEKRGHNIEFLFKTISKSNLENAVEVLTELAETYEDCVFDMPGGEDILLVALGIVYAKNPDKNIQIHKFNLRNNAIYDCDKDGNTIYRETPKLSVEENIRIYGGDIVYGDINENKTYIWDESEDFVNDINAIWSVCKEDVRLWNAIVGGFEAIEAVGEADNEDPLTTICLRAKIIEHLKRRNLKYKISHGIINYLLKHKLLTCFQESDEGRIRVTYKNEQVKKCLTKAGQALEMKIYTTAKQLRNSDGTPVYNDAINGAVIDWDGEFHDETIEEAYDTENEIDVLLMHDMVPIFISCKNGLVTAEELYKLNTVATRFGGKYAKKVLVASALDQMGEAGVHLKQRAIDMKIRVLKPKQIFDDQELKHALKTLWCN